MCWQSDVVYYLDLSRRHCAREVAEGTTLLQRVSAILGRHCAHKLCFDAGSAVQLLMQAGAGSLNLGWISQLQMQLAAALPACQYKVAPALAIENQDCNARRDFVLGSNLCRLLCVPDGSKQQGSRLATIS